MFVVILIRDYKQLLDEVFVICRIINVEVRVTLTETIILHVTKTEYNNCFILHIKWKKTKSKSNFVLL